MDTTKEKNFVSAVVYCFDDADTIGKFIECLDGILLENFLKYEIVVVNDASTDDSVGQVKEFAAHKEGKVITVLNMSHHQGLEASMNAGVDLAIGDFVFEFDYAVSDFPWTMLMKIYHHALNGYDIVSARPNTRKRFSSRLFYKVFNHYANLQHELSTETFRLLSRRAINRVHSLTESIPYRKASYANCGLSMSALTYSPTVSVKNKRHHSRMTMAVDSIILFTDLAYRMTVGLAVFMAIVTLSIGLYALLTKIYMHPVEGWATTILFLAFGFLGLFVILAMVIKYLQTIVTLIFRKKEYMFESIEKLQ